MLRLLWVGWQQSVFQVKATIVVSKSEQKCVLIWES